MTFILTTLSILFTTIAVLGAAYHLFWTVIGLIPSKRKRLNDTVPATNFAILIPAHNEAKVLGETLRSCLSLDYPNEQYSVFVVADNCTDQTIDIARSFGVTCLERSDLKLRGKNHALAWAFPQILEQTFDAILVVDADCTVEPHALRHIDHSMQQGSQAVQLNHTIGNKKITSLSFLLAAASKLENDYYYAPKSRLHAAVMLRGTGMALRSELLEKFPWNARSIVEDTEYSIELLKNGIEIQFIPEAHITTMTPEERETLAVQRTRWIGGTLFFSITYGLRFLLLGLATFRWRLADTGMTLLTLSRPMVVTQLVATWAIMGIASPWLPRSMLIPLWSSLLLAIVSYLAYAGLGVLAASRESFTFKNLIAVPFNFVTYLVIAAKSIVRSRSDSTWEKTPR